MSPSSSRRRRRAPRRPPKPPVGARPGTLVLPEGAPPPAIRVYAYSAAELTEVELDRVSALRDWLGRAPSLWVDVQGLGAERSLRELAEILSIHPLALEAIAHVPARPKTELFADNQLVVARMLRLESLATGPETEQVSLVLGSGVVTTFQEYAGDVLDPVRARLRVAGSLMRRSGVDYLAYAILDTIIDAYYPMIESLSDRLELLEDSVLAAADPRVLEELTSVKGTLAQLRRAVVPQREAINRLARDESPFVSDTTRVYFRDTYDHVVQTVEAIESAREHVSGLTNTYLSVVSNRMNEVMKTLTIVASIFVPLTFLAGIYGMNFEYMPELRWRWGYPAIVGVMLAVAVSMLVYFHRKGWFSRRD